MPLDVEERYERRAPFGVPFAESFGLHLFVIGALVSSVWLHSRIRGNEWGQNYDGAIQANLVSNAPSIPLPQVQKPTDNVLATENPSPAPAIEKEQTQPAPDLKAIPIPVKQAAKKEPPPKKDVQPKQEQKHPQPQQQPKDRANFGEQHTFVIREPVMVGGFSRFQYGGFWFGFVNPWPAGWYYTDNVYVDYIDGGYSLRNPYYPGARVSISVVM